MKAVFLLKIGKDFVKMISKSELKLNDYKHLEMYEEFVCLREDGCKIEAIRAVLSKKYNVSESTIKRVVKRFENEVNI